MHVGAIRVEVCNLLLQGTAVLGEGLLAALVHADEVLVLVECGQEAPRAALLVLQVA